MSNRFWTDKTDGVDDIVAEDFNSAFDSIVADMDKKADNTDIDELKGDLADKIDKSNYKTYIGTVVDGKWQQSNGNEYSSDQAFYVSAEVEPNSIYYASGVSVNASFPLIVLFDENDTVIGTKEAQGGNAIKNDIEFTVPSNCVKVSVNGKKIAGASSTSYNYPSVYYITNSDIDGNNISQNLNGKQSKAVSWIKSAYDYVTGKYVRYKTYKAQIASASEFKYARLTYDKTKRYRFYGECKDTSIPMVLCCDGNLNILKVFNTTVNTYSKGEELVGIPENTTYIYVNGRELSPRIEEAQERDISSFTSGKVGVFFGDSITQGNNVYISSSITPYNDYPSVVGRLLGCTIYNGGLGGSTYSSGRSIDFKNVCDCVISGDFSTVIDGISQYGLNASAVLQYNAISELNFNDVDFISIALGTNDWNFGASAEAIKNAMRYCISTLLTAYPHLKIYVFTPIYRFNLGGSGQDSDTYVNTGSGLKLHDVCDAIIETAKEFNVPCKDMYYGCNINQYNKELYMGDDTHPNANGYALMGEKIAKFINSN